PDLEYGRELLNGRWRKRSLRALPSGHVTLVHPEQPGQFALRQPRPFAQFSNTISHFPISSADPRSSSCRVPIVSTVSSETVGRFLSLYTNAGGEVQLGSRSAGDCQLRRKSPTQLEPVSALQSTRLMARYGLA